MSPTSYRLLHPAVTTSPYGAVPAVNPSRDTSPARRDVTRAERVTAGPAMPRYVTSSALLRRLRRRGGRTVAAGGAGVWPVVGEADGAWLSSRTPGRPSGGPGLAVETAGHLDVLGLLDSCGAPSTCAARGCRRWGPRSWALFLQPRLGLTHLIAALGSWLRSCPWSRAPWPCGLVEAAVDLGAHGVLALGFRAASALSSADSFLLPLSCP